MDQVLELNGVPARISLPEIGRPPHVILLLHGWTGDENSMWIFTSRLPKDAAWIAPRGMFTTPLGGYSWQKNFNRKWPAVEDLRPAVDHLLQVLQDAVLNDLDIGRVSLVGFSQGAALAYAFAGLHASRVARLAGLSGFAPTDFDALPGDRPLEGVPAFVAHGTADELVPVARARSAVEILQGAGAQVTYCEDQVGHKLSANCFRGLEAFFQKQTCA